MTWALKDIQSITADLEKDIDNFSSLEGGQHRSNLLQAAKCLAAGDGEHPFDLDKLIDIAHSKMSTSTSVDMLIAWRRYYTDACILKALSSLQIAPRDAIAKLDRAIIIAGAPGPDRLDFIHALIRKIQVECLGPLSECSPFPSTSIPCPSTPFLVPGASSAVPCHSSPPSLAAFRGQHSQSPFILRGFANSWPALQEHPWSSIRYLQSITGPGRIVPVEIGRDYREEGWTQKLMNWEEFLAHTGLEMPSALPDMSEPVYLAQHNLFMQFPALRDDLIIPDYVYASPTPIHCPSYLPPGNDDQLIINAWFGPKGTISPAHVDPYFNFYTQVVGYKTVWLAEPGISQFMHAISPRDSDVSSMENTSAIDVFAERRDGAFPDFWENVVPHAMSARLEPGDVLFFPPGWWHAMRSETTSFSVSMWF